jgi:hypothetical protein
VARINLVSSATANRASNEHLAVVDGARIAAGSGMQASLEDR